MPPRLDNYRLLDVLGRGTDSVVWLAIDRAGGRLVALKLWADPRRDAAARAVRLRHPHLLAVHDSGLGFVASELADGGRSDRWLNGFRGDAAGRRRLVCRLGAEVASALAHLHQQRWLHRDVKPSNVLLARGCPGAAEGQLSARLGDFDTVCARDDVVERVRIVGTPAYMAPEQHRGGADERSDLYALAATLVALLTGQPPFRGGDEPALLQAKQDGWQAPKGCAADPLFELLAGLLVPSPAKRHPDSAVTVHERLRELGGEPLRSGWRVERIVGREPALARLVAALERSARGDRRTALVTGPTFVGLSTVCAELRRCADALGIAVRSDAVEPNGGGLLVVEDLQTRREDEVAYLFDAIRGIRAGGPPGAMVVLTLAGDTPAGQRLRRRLAKVRWLDEVVPIAPLTVAQTRAFVESSLVWNDVTDVDALTLHLHRASGGLPALLGPYLEGQELPLPPPIRALTATETRLVRLLALLGAPCEERYWRPYRQAVRTLCARQLVRRDGRRLALAAVALGELSLARLQRWQQQSLARSLRDELRPPPDSRTALALALAAVDLRRARTALPPVCDRLAAAGRWQELVELLDRAERVAPLPFGDRGEVLLRRAEGLSELGHRDLARQAATEAVCCAVAAAEPILLARAVLASDRDEGEVAEALNLAVRSGRGDLAVRALVRLGQVDEAGVVAGWLGQEKLVLLARQEAARRAESTGALATARRAYLAIKRQAAHLGDRRMVAECCGDLGDIAHRQGDFRGARRWWQQALQRPAAEVSRRLRLRLFWNLALAAWRRGRFLEAETYFADYLARVRGSDDRRAELKLLTNYMVVQAELLRPDAAIGAAGRALQLAEELDDAEARARVQSNLVYVLAVLGQDRAAESHAREVATGTASDQQRAMALRNLSDVFARRAIVFPLWRHECRRLLQEARGLVRAGDLRLEVELDLLALEARPTARVRDRVARIIAQAAKSDDRLLERKARVVQVRVLAARGANRAARRRAERALRDLRRAPLGEATLDARAALAAVTGRLDHHRRVVETVEAIARRIGADHARTFQARYDVAVRVLAAVEAALRTPDGVSAARRRRALGLAQRLSELLTGCPRIGWRADAQIGRLASELGLDGVASFRLGRARQAIARDVAVALEARLNPELAPLLRGL